MSTGKAELRIRVARPDDMAAVGAVLTASYPALLAGTYDADLLARALPLMTRPHPQLLSSGRYYLCEAEGAAVGCGGWSFERPGTDETEAGLAHIRHFATAADWAGRGVGRLLFERCRIEAGAAGARMFEAYATMNGEPFYRALGFERVEPIEVPMGPDVLFPSIRMRRAIRAARNAKSPRP